MKRRWLFIGVVVVAMLLLGGSGTASTPGLPSNHTGQRRLPLLARTQQPRPDAQQHRHPKGRAGHDPGHRAEQHLQPRFDRHRTGGGDQLPRNVLRQHRLVRLLPERKRHRQDPHLRVQQRHHAVPVRRQHGSARRGAQTLRAPVQLPSEELDAPVSKGRAYTFQIGGVNNTGGALQMLFDFFLTPPHRLTPAPR